MSGNKEESQKKAPEYDIPLHLDTAGFVWAGKVKMPFKYLPDKRAIQVKIKDKRIISMLGADKVLVSVVDIFLLSALYTPMGDDPVFDLKCPSCENENLAHFKGKIINEDGSFKLICECLFCDYQWQPMGVG